MTQCSDKVSRDRLSAHLVLDTPSGFRGAGLMTDNDGLSATSEATEPGGSGSYYGSEYSDDDSGTDGISHRRVYSQVDSLEEAARLEERIGLDGDVTGDSRMNIDVGDGGSVKVLESETDWGMTSSEEDPVEQHMRELQQAVAKVEHENYTPRGITYYVDEAVKSVKNHPVASDTASFATSSEASHKKKNVREDALSAGSKTGKSRANSVRFEFDTMSTVPKVSPRE